MEALIEINNKTTAKISKQLLADILKKTVEKSGYVCLKKKTVHVSVAAVEEKEIEEINYQYRKKKAPTDVLSFAEYNSLDELCGEEEQVVSLGELIICPSIIEESLHDQSFSKHQEYVYIVSHGILHLLGFDHGEIMYGIQDEIVAQLS